MGYGVLLKVIDNIEVRKVGANTQLIHGLVEFC
jgi:hypothetical protein